MRQSRPDLLWTGNGQTRQVRWQRQGRRQPSLLPQTAEVMIDRFAGDCLDGRQMAPVLFSGTLSERPMDQCGRERIRDRRLNMAFTVRAAPLDNGVNKTVVCGTEKDGVGARKGL